MAVAAAITVALLADLLTATRTHELNPLAIALMSQPLLMFAAKVAEIAIVVSVIALLTPSRPIVASFIALLAITAGVVGTISNIT